MAKKIFIILGLLCVIASPATASNLSNAFGKNMLGNVATEAGYKPVQADEVAGSVVGRIVKVALSFVGVIFLLLMVYGGYLWMTARGNEQQVEKAKDLITAAIIGMIVVLSAYAITYFLLEQIGQETLQNV